MCSLKYELEKYSKDILDNKIPACQKHKWACERFLNDLKNQNTKHFPYVFNEQKANRFLKWMGLFKHSKGNLSGQYINPHIIQKFVFGNVYGWEHVDTKLRRFNKAFWQVSRKNAKSQGLAIVATYELSALGEMSSEVYCAGVKKEQSRIVWDEADNMIRNSPFLKKKFKTTYGRVQHIKSGSFFRALSKDDRKSGDGLNPQCGIIDEYHSHQTSEYYDILESGMAARRQPLMFIITTAGFELNNPCYRVEYQYLSKILNPSIDLSNEEYFVLINELEKDNDGNLIDDIEDESTWVKANPIVADPTNETGINYLRSRVKMAKDEPEKLRDVLTKNFNVWVNVADNKYLDMEKWKNCGKREMPKCENIELIGGIDLASTIDLCSFSGVYIKDDKVCVISHSFIPQETLHKKIKTDRVPYDLWFKQGWLTVTQGAEVDYRYITKWIENFERTNNVEINEICYDKWNATQFAHEMEDLGYTMIEIRQGIQTLSEPTKKFRAMVYNNEIYHDNNPLLTWAISNAITKIDSNENIMLDKSKSIERIDPIASAINAFTRSIVLFDNGVYDSRPEGERLFAL